MEQNMVRKQLFSLMENDYQKFASSLLPQVDNVLGVRLPELRKIAKKIAKEDWRTYLDHAEHEYFEEKMLHGMVIGYVKTDVEDVLSYVASFVPIIDNWSVCDSFCSCLKMTKEHRNRVWEFLQPYLSSNKEYDVRFAVVMFLHYYIEAEYLDEVLHLLDHVKHEGYYAKMAVAWAISICYVKFPSQTMEYLKNNTLDDFTYHKALQKITESNRVNKETKRQIRQMKRR